MEHSFHVGDKVRLSAYGLAEVATLEEPMPIPFGVGTVRLLGWIDGDDVVVDFEETGLQQCGPDWLIMVEC